MFKECTGKCETGGFARKHDGCQWSLFTCLSRFRRRHGKDRNGFYKAHQDSGDSPSPLLLSPPLLSPPLPLPLPVMRRATQDQQRQYIPHLPHNEKGNTRSAKTIHLPIYPIMRRATQDQQRQYIPHLPHNEKGNTRSAKTIHPPFTP